MTFQDWLIVIGVIIILGILLDGYRRMRLEKSDSLKMSRNMGGEIESSPLDDDFNPELPGGGARIVGRDGVTDTGVTDTGVTEAGAAETSSEMPDERLEPRFGSETPEMPEGGVDDISAPEPALVAEREDRNEAEHKEVHQKHIQEQPKTPVIKAGKKKSRKSGVSTENAAPASASSDQEVLVINVDAKPSQVFKGSEIKKLLEACGMDHGEMSIFHRHEEDDLLSPIQFSVANAVEPGYFDPEKMSDLVTPGVSFFMSLPGPKDYMRAFEYMLETAQCFASNLNGELRDERRSVLTPQTIEHCKQRVRDFELKQLSRSKNLS